MTRLRLTIAAIAAAFTASTATADFTFTTPGPVNSAGPIGDIDNGSFSGVFGGPSAIWGTLNFSGDLTSVISGTFASEARWQVVLPGGGSFNYQPSTTAGFAGTLPIAASTGVFVFAAPGTYTFNAFESFNDGAGPDASWANPSFNFVDSTTPITLLGEFANNTQFSFDTITSDYDTELGLYDSNGNLLANNDDIAPGNLQSLINAGILAPGTYTLLAGGFNSSFGTGAAAAGGASGNLNLQLNGANLFGGASTSGQFNIFQFDVSSTPAPAAVWMGVIGVGALAGLRRRFKKA